MSRRTLSLLLAISVVIGDGVPVVAQTCRAIPQTVDPILTDITVITGDAVFEDEDRSLPVPDRLGRQVLCEPFEECDSDELSDALPFASTIGICHYKFRSAFCLPVRYETTSRISMHLRI